MASIDPFPGQWQPQVVLMAALEVGLTRALLDRPQMPGQVAQALAVDERASLNLRTTASGAPSDAPESAKTPAAGHRLHNTRSTDQAHALSLCVPVGAGVLEC